MGGVVTAGTANIVNSGRTTTITQSSNKAAINWLSFSVGKAESVHFVQPNAQSITLNRVVGSERSLIEGALRANGQVWILNSNGVLFNNNASVNVGGLLASTLQMSDQRFMRGEYRLESNGSQAAVLNQGSIQIAPGGYAVLAGKEVGNEGRLIVAKGQVHLVGANEVSVQFDGNSLLGLSVDKGVLDALVQNKGVIQADGGAIYLTANAVNELLRGVVNTSGTVQADSLDGITGKVVVFAHGGLARVDGTLSAQGGLVETSGAKVDFASNLNLQAKDWLIDPNNIRIVSDATAEANVADNGGSPYGYSSSNDTTVLRASTIQAKLNASTSVTVQTGTAGANTESGDITVSSNITKTAGGDATLTLKAARSVIVDGASISSSNGKLHTVLHSRYNGNDAGTDANYGGIWVKQGSSINTNGGDVTMGGGTNPLTGYAVGVDIGQSAESNAQYRGVTINGTVLANAGNIVINGKGGGSVARGVSIGGTVSTIGSGTVQISGVARGSSDGIALGDTAVGLNGTVSAQNGNITLSGTKNTGTNGVNISTAASAITTTGSGSVTLQSTAGSIGLSGGVTTGTGGTITLNSAAAVTQGSGALTSTFLTLRGSGTHYTLTNTNNDVGQSMNTDGTVGNLSYVDKTGVTVSAVAATGVVDIATLSGDLTVSGNISTTSTASNAITLNAGKNAAAGTGSGGNIVISGSPTLSTGTGGRATLYTGTLAGSTGVGTLVGAGSARFRYNSDESSTNYSTALGSGTHAIYREQPTLSVTANNQSVTYGIAPSPTTSITGYQNGDTAVQAISSSPTVSVGGSTSAAGHYTAGSHTLSAAGAASGLGYVFGYTNGTLTVTPKTLSLSAFDVANKTYDGSTIATVNTLGTISGVLSGDAVSFSHSGSATFSDKNVGAGKTVTLNGVALSGADAGNYSVVNTTTASIVPQASSTQPSTTSPELPSSTKTPSPTGNVPKTVEDIVKNINDAAVKSNPQKSLDETIREIVANAEKSGVKIALETVEEKQNKLNQLKQMSRFFLFFGSSVLFSGATPDVTDARILKMYKPDINNALNTELAKTYKTFGYTPNELIKAGYGNVLRGAGFAPNELKNVSISDLRQAGYSAKEIYNSGRKINEFPRHQFSADELLAIGATPRELKDIGFSSAELKAAGIDLKQLVQTGFSFYELKQANASISDLISYGASLQDLKNAGYSAKDLMLAGYTLKQLREIGMPIENLKRGGLTANDLSKAGLTYKEISDAGFSFSELKALGASAKDLQNIGATPKQLAQAGYKASEVNGIGYDFKKLYEAGYSLKQLRESGASINDLKNLGASLIDLHGAGFALPELKREGYNAKDFEGLLRKTENDVNPSSKNATQTVAGDKSKNIYQKIIDIGFDAKDLVSSGVIRSLREAVQYLGEEAVVKSKFDLTELLVTSSISIASLRKAGHSPSNMIKILKSRGWVETLIANFEPNELIAAGISPSQIMRSEAYRNYPGKFSAEKLLAAGASLRDLLDAKVSFSNLRQAGVSAADLKKNGATLDELVAAKYGAAELYKAGYAPVGLKIRDFEARSLLGIYSNEEIKNTYSIKELQDEGFSLREIREVGFSPLDVTRSHLGSGSRTPGEIRKLVDAGYGAGELMKAGFDASDLHYFYTPRQLREGGFRAEDLRSGGFSINEINAAGYPSNEANQATSGVRIDAAKKLRASGKSALDLYYDGYSTEEIRAAGYNDESRAKVDREITRSELEKLRKSGSNPFALRKSGQYSTKQLANVFTAKELKTAGFKAIDLWNAGVSEAELRVAGYNQTQIERAKKGFSE